MEAEDVNSPLASERYAFWTAAWSAAFSGKTKVVKSTPLSARHLTRRIARPHAPGSLNDTDSQQPAEWRRCNRAGGECLCGIG